MVQLPPFYKENPEVWFTKVESAINVAKFTTFQEKVDFFISNVDVEVLTLITDIIKRYPRQDKYNLDDFEYDFLPDIQKRIMTKFKSLGKTEFCKLFKDDPVSMGQRTMELEKKINEYASNFHTLEKSLAELKLKVDDSVLANVSIEKRIVAIEEKIKDSGSSSILDKYVAEVNQWIDNFIASNSCVDERILTLEEKMNGLSASAVLETAASLNNFAAELKQKMDDSDASHVLLNQRMVALEEKIKDSASSIVLDKDVTELKPKENDSIALNSSVDHRITALEEKAKDSATNDSLNKQRTELEKKIDDSCNSSLVRVNTAVWNFNKRMKILEEMMESHSKAFPNKMTKLKKKLDVLRDKHATIFEEKPNDHASNASLNGHIEELKKKIDHSVALNTAVKNCIAVLEEQINDSAPNVSLEESTVASGEKQMDSASQVSIHKSLIELKNQVEDLTASIVSLKNYVTDLESKMVEPVIPTS